MRLQCFLREGSEKDLISSIEKNCSYFLRDMKGSRYLFYRGIYYKIEDFEIRKSHLNDRTAMNMPQETHKKLNIYFKKKFGWEARNGVFTYGNIDEVGSYGEEYIFLPIGNFKFVWHPDIKDLYFNIKNKGLQNGSKPGPDKIFEDFVSEYKDNGIKEAVKSSSEVIFKCDSYYLLNQKYGKDVLEMLK